MERRKIREKNAKYPKMIKCRNMLKYKKDLTDQEKESLSQGERKFSRMHVGRKIVEAYVT